MELAFKDRMYQGTWKEFNLSHIRLRGTNRRRWHFHHGRQYGQFRGLSSLGDDHGKAGRLFTES